MSLLAHDILAGIATGVLCVFLIIYAFQPNRPYPSWMLEPAERPWVILIVFIVIVYLFQWDYVVGTLALLFVLALVLDMILFTTQITDGMRIPETLFTPAMDLVPSIKTSELFGPVVLKDEEQVSKKWTINKDPYPYDMRRNKSVDKNDNAIDPYVSLSGLPLFAPSIENVYPIFI